VDLDIRKMKEEVHHDVNPILCVYMYIYIYIYVHRYIHMYIYIH